jgi:hypothetical protein
VLREINLEHELLQDLKKFNCKKIQFGFLFIFYLPPITSTNSDPFIERNGTPASAATALANNVLPIPGGPRSKAPLGTFAPNA